MPDIGVKEGGDVVALHVLEGSDEEVGRGRGWMRMCKVVIVFGARGWREMVKAWKV